MHHAPADLLFSTAAVHLDDSREAGIEKESAAPEAESDPEPSSSESAKRDSLQKIEIASASAQACDSEDGRRERDYFDELQDAAAGLAKLMRSSPVERSEPVVFAPVEAEVVTVLSEIEEEFVAEFVETTEFVEAQNPTEVEPIPAVEVALRVLSPRELLGDGVFAQFAEIDEGLEALEELVGSIETSLRLLRDGEFDSNAAPERIDPMVEVSEAA